jgi:DNA-binding CsgD family transcriptional regulator
VVGAVRARWDKDSPGGLELPELTARESDVLGAVAQGLSIRQVARQLGIAPKTVENVQTRLFRKLGVRNRSGALAVADAFGLLPERSEPEHATAADIPDYPDLGTPPGGYSSLTRA